MAPRPRSLSTLVVGGGGLHHNKNGGRKIFPRLKNTTIPLGSYPKTTFRYA